MKNLSGCLEQKSVFTLSVIDIRGSWSFALLNLDKTSPMMTTIIHSEFSLVERRFNQDTISAFTEER